MKGPAFPLLAVLLASTGAQGAALLVQTRGEAQPPPEARVTDLALPGWQRWELPGEAAAALARVRALPGVAWAEADAPRRPDRLPGEYGSGRLDYVDQAGLPGLWERLTAAPGVTLGVVDDAVDAAHPDLRDNLLPPLLLRRDNSDPLAPCPGALQRPRHGTQVAGVAGALGDNGLGTAGVLWQGELLVAQLGCAFGVSDALDAYQRLADAGARIVNYSYSGEAYSPAEWQAVQALGERGVLLVASAGNGHGEHLDAPVYPAALKLPNLITVGALDGGGAPATWSASGPFTVDLWAPGQSLYTTDVGGGYATVSGTSYAAPLVSGVLALLQAARPQAGAAELRAALLAGARPLEAAYRGYARTDARLDAAGALAALEAGPAPLYLLREAVVMDDEAGDGDGAVDPGETFQLVLTLENAGTADGTAAHLSLQVASGPVRVLMGEADLDGLAAQKEGIATFTLRADAFSAHRRALLSLRIQDGGVDQTRHFPLHLGAVGLGETVRATLQQTPYDHRHRYHLHTPAGPWVVELAPERAGAVQLAYTRNTGTWPAVYFQPGRQPAVAVRGQRVAEAPVMRLAGEGAGDLRLSVFQPPAGSEEDAPPTGYRLRLCGDPTAEGNRPPRLSLPPLTAAEAGQPLTLQAGADDPDGTVWSTWWEQTAGPAPLALDDPYAPSLTLAPSEPGRYTLAFHASDDDCAESVAETVLEIDTPSGEQDTQRERYTVREGGTLHFTLPPTTDYRLRGEPPPGARFQNNQFQWDSAGPAGQYRLVFDGGTETRTVIVVVEPRSQSVSVQRGASSVSFLLVCLYFYSLAATRRRGRR